MDNITRFLRSKNNILTERLQLKNYDLRYVDELYEIFSSDKVTKYINKIETKRQIEDLINKKVNNYMKFYGGEWLIERTKDKKIIGVFSIFFDLENNSSQISYVLGDKYWGNGYCIEICKEILSICFNEIELYRVEADCVGANVTSVKLLKKLGMKYEGSERAGSFNKVDNKFYDFEYYAILKSEYSLK